MMSESQEQQNSTIVPAARRPSKKRVFKMPDGQCLPVSDFKSISKHDKDVVIYYHGEEKQVTPATGKKKERVEWVTEYNPDQSLGEAPLTPSIQSPICAHCGLYEHNSRNPFMAYGGANQPLVTIIFDSVSRGEDVQGELGKDGSPAVIRRIIQESSQETGVTLRDVRWVPMTRCTNWFNKMVDLKSRGNWCRYHVVDDLMRHPPAMVMPVGTTALGLLSHKSNAQEWTGRLLTYRGWPDDWLMLPKYALPRSDPRAEGKMITGHPLFGSIPDTRIPMVPIQSPRLIFATQNPVVYSRWAKSIVDALKMAKQGTKALSYTRDWYRFTEDADTIEFTLNELLEHPGILLSYDTETTGLRQWAKDAAIVSMMFRWTDPATGKPRSLGFPWDFGPTPEHPEWEASPLRPYMGRLKMLIWKVLTQSTLIGHNLTFDMLYTYATFWRKHLLGWTDPEFNRQRDSWLVALADACHYDTWHMAFAWLQRRGSLGLEVLAYDWVPDLAGYEEDMTLMIGLNYEAMHPKAGKGGHYLNCPKDKWQTHLVPYVMGDVEVCYQAREKIQHKLETSNVYTFPLATPGSPGRFRLFEPPDRNWLYQNIMSPASQVLMKMMARGLYINEATLTEMEQVMPLKIMDLRDKLKVSNPLIGAWCDTQEHTVLKEKGEQWQFDLEDRGQLKELLFKHLKLPVLRFTKGGRKLLGDDVEKAKQAMAAAIAAEKPELEGDAPGLEAAVQEQLQEVAAIDKFTLNKMCVQFENLRPLQGYRKLFKLYSTYVRPLRNMFTAKLDKKARTADPHLCFDECIHASFLQTGTRTGRLSCRNPNLQQLPRDGIVKSMFVSRFGERGCMYQGDLSQIELRLMAAACGDPTMIKAYDDKIDLHSLTASRIYNTPYAHYTKEHMKDLQDKGFDKEAKELELNRVTAKTVNFLTGYGGGAFGLQNVLAMKDIWMKIEECQEIIEAFFESYPALRAWLQDYKRFILDTHVAVSIFGRVRVFEEVRGDDEEAKAKALRAGCNHVIQSTASDMMLTALRVIEQMMREADLESILVSTVHDSLVIDAVRDELAQVHEIVLAVLNNFPGVFKVIFGADYDTSWMLVPFSGDCEVGLDYLSTRKIPEKGADWDKLLAVEA
jgi:DNA polymerase I-like protein with 3'-5' exonuclease and polymerase domains